MQIYNQQSQLVLTMNIDNTKQADHIFEFMIYPAISHELRLAIQHCKATLNVRAALQILSTKIIITNKLPYLAKLNLMLHDTRLLPGDTIDMLVCRVDSP